MRIPSAPLLIGTAAAFGILALIWIAALAVPSPQARVTIEVLTPQGDRLPDARFRLLVGYLRDGAQGAPTLGNIVLVDPDAGRDHRYTLPALRKIGVFLMRAGHPAQTHILWLQSGTNTTHVIRVTAPP